MSVLSGLNLDKMYGLLFLRDRANCPLNSSTIDELGEGAWTDGGASSTGAEHVG